MTRQEAERVLFEVALFFDRRGEEKDAQRVREAYKFFAEQKPTPDPETGLVPCGCGGKLELRKRSALLSGLRKPEYIHWVVCRKCHWSTMDCTSKEMAIRLANEAMGLKENE
ncbi:MAG: hypothetical protein ACOX63_10130 [Christensenellales bacterium]|jgi:hypothetical protein